MREDLNFRPLRCQRSVLPKIPTLSLLAVKNKDGAGNEIRTRDPHVGNVMHDPRAYPFSPLSMCQ